MEKISLSTLKKMVNFAITAGKNIMENLKAAEKDSNVVIIHGRHDQLASYEAAIYAQGILENSSLILENAGHAPFLENCQKFSGAFSSK